MPPTTTTCFVPGWSRNAISRVSPGAISFSTPVKSASNLGAPGPPSRQAENNGNTGKSFLVYLLHEFERRRPDRDNQIRFTIPIFANVEIAELLLDGRIGEQRGIHVLGIELKMIRRIIQRSFDSLIDDGDRGIGRVYFVQNQNPSNFLCGRSCSRAGQGNGGKSRKGNPDVTCPSSSRVLRSRRERPTVIGAMRQFGSPQSTAH